MAGKPSYEALEQRVKLLEKEIEEFNSNKETLKEIENLYKTLIDGPLFAMIIHDVAPYFVTKKAAALFGYDSPDELMKSISDIETLFHEKFRVNMKERRARRYITKETSIVEISGLRKDGTEIPLMVGINVTDWKGKPAIQCTYFDLSDLKQARDDLKESEERYRNLIEGSVQGILIHRDHKPLFVNQAWASIHGYTREEILRMASVVTLMAPEDQKQMVEYKNSRMRGDDAPGSYEYRGIRKDGSLVWLENRVMMVQWDGKPAIQTIVFDITERKHAELKVKEHADELGKLNEALELKTKDLKETNTILRNEISERKIAQGEALAAKGDAEKANHAKSEFLANVSHELRTPLNHIIGFTELVVDKVFGELNEKQKELLDDALESARHLYSLINDILDLSRVEAGKLELKLSEINLSALLANSMNVVREEAFKHNLELDISVDDIPETVRLDERVLRQILYNLLANATKFTPDGGRIRLSAQTVPLDHTANNSLNEELFDKGIEFSVSDTGIGIRSENHHRIFNPFERVDESKTRNHDGTGLGLSLSRKLVELHGGNLWVESEGDNKGSAFRFIIPIGNN